MTLQAAAQGLVDRIADLGASPLDWSEYTALEKALEAAQAVEPVAWLVLDEDRVPIMCAPAKQMCNDHINDAINDFDITEASKWVVREAFTHPAPPPYDQQALELCDKCGWKAIIPGEPCLNCGRGEVMKALDAYAAERDALAKTLEAIETKVNTLIKERDSLAADGARYQFMKSCTRAAGLDISGWHSWTCQIMRSDIKGATLDQAIDTAIKKAGAETKTDWSAA